MVHDGSSHLNWFMWPHAAMCLFFTVYGVMRPAVPAHVVCCTPNTSDFELPEICLFPLTYNKVNVMKSLCKMLRYYMKQDIRLKQERPARGVVTQVLWWLGGGGCCPWSRLGYLPLPRTEPGGISPPLSPSSSPPARTRTWAPHEQTNKLKTSPSRHTMLTKLTKIIMDLACRSHSFNTSNQPSSLSPQSMVTSRTQQCSPQL